jgi:hypothetical protein
VDFSTLRVSEITFERQELDEIAMIIESQTVMNPPVGGWRFHLAVKKQIIYK